MNVSQLLPPERLFLDIPACTREEALVFVADRLEQAGTIRRAQDLVDLLLDRARMGATVVGDQTAIPHCRVPGLRGVVAAFARSPEPVSFDLGTGLARLFFFVISPAEQPAVHLQCLASIAGLPGDPAVRSTFEGASDAAALSQALALVEGPR